MRAAHSLGSGGIALQDYPECEALELREAAWAGLGAGRAGTFRLPSVWKTVAALERAAALALLLALLPWLLLAGVIVVLLSRRCPLVAHARVGQHGKPIRVLKLRTMWPVAAPRKGLLVERLNGTAVPGKKKADDPRITSAFALACRKYSIDELPQVLRARPGLTGLWQIRGGSVLNYRQRRRLDLFLVRRWSLRLYVTILFGTIPKVLTGKNAW